MTRFTLAVVVLIGLSAIAGSQSTTVVGVSTPTTVSSVIVPPATERSVMFTDRGRTYLVGTQSGKVTVLDGSPVVPNPVVPVVPSLTGIAKQAYDSLMASPIDPQNRVAGAKALISAIDSTLGEVGGLNIDQPQEIINRFAANAEAAQVNVLLRGWHLGDLLANANIVTKEQLLAALEDIKRGLKEIR